MLDASVPVQRKWPSLNITRRGAIICDSGLGLADLWERSPRRFEDNDCHAEEIIDALFPDNPLLCCAWANDRFDTRPREDWRGQLGDLARIVPSPMSKRRGLTKDYRTSTHTLDNTGPRRFIVTEFDTGTLDEQAALLLHLNRHLPLVCVVFSGNKSLHGWFPVTGLPEPTVREFFTYGVALGADPALWTKSQFVRMPDGRHDKNGNRQTCYFLDFDTLRNFSQ